MSEITITLPAVEPLLNLAVETEAAAAVAVANEESAFAAILAKYSDLARHGQRIKTALYECHNPGQRVSISEEAFLRSDGKIARGFVLIDNWEELGGGNSDDIGGVALVMADGRFWKLEYTGRWSRWQGAADWWAAGDTTRHINNMDPRHIGSHNPITPAEAAAEFDLADVLRGLAKALAETADRLPKRLARVKQRAALAAEAAARLV